MAPKGMCALCFCGFSTQCSFIRISEFHCNLVRGYYSKIYDIHFCSELHGSVDFYVPGVYRNLFSSIPMYTIWC